MSSSLMFSLSDIPQRSFNRLFNAAVVADPVWTHNIGLGIVSAVVYTYMNLVSADGATLLSGLIVDLFTIDDEIGTITNAGEDICVVKSGSGPPVTGILTWDISVPGNITMKITNPDFLNKIRIAANSFIQVNTYGTPVIPPPPPP